MNLSPHLQRAIEIELKDAYLKGRQDERKKDTCKMCYIHMTPNRLCDECFERMDRAEAQ